MGLFGEKATQTTDHATLFLPSAARADDARRHATEGQALQPYGAMTLQCG
jgi:hypothetical protein